MDSFIEFDVREFGKTLGGYGALGAYERARKGLSNPEFAAKWLELTPAAAGSPADPAAHADDQNPHASVSVLGHDAACAIQCLNLFTCALRSCEPC